MRSTVLVTGAAGFLGARVAAALAATGRHEVRATDVTPAAGVRVADLRDTAAVEELVRGVDVVVHLAAVRGRASAVDPHAAHDVNVGATVALATLAARHGVRRVVYGSSHLVYGAFDDPARAAFTEADAAVAPGLSVYAASKLAAEALLGAVCGADGPDHVALRLGTIYGPRINADSTNGLLVAVLAGLDHGEKVAIPWTRDTRHAMVHVDDAARAAVAAVEVPGEVRGAVNVVGPPVTAGRLYPLLVELAGGDPGLLDWRDERSRHQLVAADRLRTVLGLPTLTTLDDGLATVVDWYRSDARSEGGPR